MTVGFYCRPVLSRLKNLIGLYRDRTNPILETNPECYQRASQQTTHSIYHAHLPAVCAKDAIGFVTRALCILRLINENRRSIMEYYTQVRKIYFYAAVGLLEGTNPTLC